MVLDSGDGVSHAVPVYEGFEMRNSIRRIDIAGRDVTEYLQMLLRKSGYVFHTSAEREVVKQIKEKCCYVSVDPAREEKEWMGLGMAGLGGAAGDGRVGGGSKGEGKMVEYTLPDGHKLKVRFSIALLRLHMGFTFPPTTRRVSRDSTQLTRIQLAQERFRAPEILFNPSHIGLEYEGLPSLLVSAINRSDMDLRKDLFKNILLSGGRSHSFSRYCPY